MNQYRLIFSIFAMVFWWGVASIELAEAACQGASPERTAANNSQAEVVACINAAVDGDTINVPAGSGSVTWSGFTLPNTKGLTLKGPGKTNLTVTLNGSITMHCLANRPHRLSGFRFVGSSAAVVVLGTCRDFRIDNNEFNNPSENYIQINAGIDLAGPLYGVIDNNTIIASENRRILLYSGGIEWGKRTNWPEGSRLGSADNIYIEDNTFNFSTQSNPGLGVVDSNSGAAYVFRYNYVRNASMKSHPVCSSEGTANQSAYENTFVSDSGVTSGYRSIHNQGSGEAVIFNNTFTATGSKSGSVIDILHYRSADPATAGCGLYPRCDGSSQNAAWDGNKSPTSTYYGYRCRYQPGSKAGPNGTSLLSPIYAWNNKWSDTGGRVDVQISDPWGGQVAIHVQKNRDIYEAGSVNAQTSSTSPFNGTTGVGFGLLQYRPTTCTTNANESGGGVGYWATDTKTLYRCSATNTWVSHYKPYNYPHPLTQLDTPDTAPPTSPTNLAANATSQSSITVSWTAATDNIGVTGYQVERCLGLSCSTFAQVGTPANSPFTDSNLTASTGYSYHVRAVDAAGNMSGWSNVAGATTQVPDTMPPTTPTNLTVTLSSSSPSSTTSLSWTASTDAVGVTGYKVERCSGSNCTTFTQIATTTTTSYQDAGLTPQTLYRYQVRATDAANNNSSYSSIAQATTQDTLPISDSLMLGLSFNEGSGTTTQDVSGHDNAGTLQDGTAWNTTGKYGNSLTFDGVDDVVNIGNPTTLNLTSSFTLSAWVYPTSFSGDRDIITKVNDSSSDYHLQETNSGQIQVGFSSGGSWYTATTTTTLSLNTWTHVTGVFDDTNNALAVYLNGTQSTQLTGIIATPPSSTNPVHVGMGWSNQSWNGRIDDVRIYNNALTQSEIQTDMNTPLTTGGGNSTPTSCSTVTPTNFTSSTYTGYGAPYDVFASNTPLISTTCTASDTHTINTTFGITGDTTRIVYTKGYYYDPGISDWASFTGTCTGALNGDWCRGSVSTSITDSDISTASTSDPAYLVGMTCSIQGGKWKCGCRDTTCSNFYWQVQGAGM